MNMINLEEVQNIINNKHPKQIINEIGNIRIGLYYFKYSYTTNKNNRKKAIKYLITESVNPSLNLEEKLNSWVKDFNEKNPYRAISNVKFLEGSCIGLVSI